MLKFLLIYKKKNECFIIFDDRGGKNLHTRAWNRHFITFISFCVNRTYPLHCGGVGAKNSVKSIGETHCQRSIGHAGAVVVPSGAWQCTCVSTSWMRKPLMRLSGPLRLPESNRAPLGRHVSMQPLSLRGTMDCPEADWCPNQGLVGDPPGDHRSCHWEHVQMQAHPGIWSRNTADPHWGLSLEHLLMLDYSLFKSAYHALNIYVKRAPWAYCT